MEKVQIPISTISRELMEKAYREIQAKQAERKEKPAKKKGA